MHFSKKREDSFLKSIRPCFLKEGKGTAGNLQKVLGSVYFLGILEAQFQFQNDCEGFEDIVLFKIF
jgi:hypothetical protein